MSTLKLKTKALIIVPAMITLYTAIGSNPSAGRDPGFKCSNGGLVVVAVENQTTRAIANKYCTGNVDKANDALVKRYRGTIIPHWAFINVESLGR